MSAGLLLIAFGILVALFPQILVAIVSTILILMGLGLCLASWQWRRLRPRSHIPFVNWMIRW